MGIVDVLNTHTPFFYHALRFSEPSELKDFYPEKDIDAMNWQEQMALGEKRPEWQGIANYAQEMINKTTSAEDFERKMVECVKDVLNTRATQTYPIDVGIAPSPDYNAGSLKYDPPKDGQPKTNCVFHIANAISPQSIFDSPTYLPKCFLTLMEKSEKDYGYTTLTTSTWLNDYPRWLAIFPEEWLANLSPPSENIGWHFGYWGQMVTARGTFNHKAGDYLRQHGVMKYKIRHSSCSFANMKEKMYQIIYDCQEKQ